MKYYLCTKEPERKETNINMFITYTFGDGRVQNLGGGHYDGTPQIYLGYIYHTTQGSDNYICDDNMTRHKLIALQQYLTPYEFKLDEDAERFIKNKKEKGDWVELRPLKLHEDGSVTYACDCTVTDEHGRYSNSVVLTMSQADVIKECYRLLRKRDKFTNFWKDIIKKKVVIRYGKRK